MKTIVISAINIREGCPLSILKDFIDSLLKPIDGIEEKYAPSKFNPLQWSSLFILGFIVIHNILLFIDVNQ